MAVAQRSRAVAGGGLQGCAEANSQGLEGLAGPGL